MSLESDLIYIQFQALTSECPDQSTSFFGIRISRSGVKITAAKISSTQVCAPLGHGLNIGESRASYNMLADNHTTLPIIQTPGQSLVKIMGVSSRRHLLSTVFKS